MEVINRVHFTTAMVMFRSSSSFPVIVAGLPSNG